MQRLLTVLAVCCGLLAVTAGAATAGTLSPSGWAEDTPDLPNQVIGIHPDNYQQHSWQLSTVSRDLDMIVAPFVDITPRWNDNDDDNNLWQPGECGQNLGFRSWTCRMFDGPSGQFFDVVESDGKDNLEVGCATAEGEDFAPTNSPCPRRFRVYMRGGNDIFRYVSAGIDTQLNPAYWLTQRNLYVNAGTGNDQVLINPGPAGGVIDLGPGNDVVQTQYAEGPFLIICGTGNDTVATGPLDHVNPDCENTMTPTVGDLASTCGQARFDWYSNIGKRGFVRKGRKACTFLVSNALAHEMLSVAVHSQLKDVSQVFIKLYIPAVQAQRQKNETVKALFKKKFEEELKKFKPNSRWFVEHAFETFVGLTLEANEKIDPMYDATTRLTGDSAKVVGAGLRVSQIVTYGACLQFNVTVNGDTAKVENLIVYNPRRFREKSGSYAKVYNRFGKVRNLNLSCTGTGKVSTLKLRDTGKVFESFQTFAHS